MGATCKLQDRHVVVVLVQVKQAVEHGTHCIEVLLAIVILTGQVAMHSLL